MYTITTIVNHVNVGGGLLMKDVVLMILKILREMMYTVHSGRLKEVGWMISI